MRGVDWECLYYRYAQRGRGRGVGCTGSSPSWKGRIIIIIRPFQDGLLPVARREVLRHEPTPRRRSRWDHHSSLWHPVLVPSPLHDLVPRFHLQSMQLGPLHEVTMGEIHCTPKNAYGVRRDNLVRRRGNKRRRWGAELHDAISKRKNHLRWASVPQRGHCHLLVWMQRELYPLVLKHGFNLTHRKCTSSPPSLPPLCNQVCPPRGTEGRSFCCRHRKPVNPGAPLGFVPDEAHHVASVLMARPLNLERVNVPGHWKLGLSKEQLGYLFSRKQDIRQLHPWRCLILDHFWPAPLLKDVGPHHSDQRSPPRCW